jgi:hypothetical protein
MPITRSELMYFAAGVAVGAVARSAYPQLKERFGPLVAEVMASAGSAIRDSYAEVSRRVAETVEVVQDATATMQASGMDNAAAEKPASAA